MSDLNAEQFEALLYVIACLGMMAAVLAGIGEDGYSKRRQVANFFRAVRGRPLKGPDRLPRGRRH